MSEYTQKQANQAAETASQLYQQNALVQVTIATMMASRSLYMAAAQALQRGVQQQVTEDPELVLETLHSHVLKQADESQDGPREIQQALLNTAVPFLDVLAEHAYSLESNQQEGE